MSNALHLSFFETTREVFELMLDLQKVPKSAIMPGENAYGSLTISIGMTGDLTGDTLYMLPKEAMLEMVRIMTGGMEVSEVDDFVTSAIGEISNIISGKAMIALLEKNVTCDILPSKAIGNEEGVCVYPMDSSIKISTEIGSVGLGVRLQSR